MRKPAPGEPWTLEKAGTVLLRVKVDPRSSRPGLAGRHGDALRVRLSAPPVDGKANRELVATLAKLLGVPKSHVEVVGGLSSRMKTVRLSGISPETLAGRLKSS